MQRVKLAKTDEEKRKVYDYFKAKGTIPATNTFYYKENEKGEVAGAYGVEIKVCIEPLQSEGAIITKELFDDALARIDHAGYEKVHVLTENPKVTKLLMQRYSAVQWSSQVDELMLILNK